MQPSSRRRRRVGALVLHHASRHALTHPLTNAFPVNEYRARNRRDGSDGDAGSGDAGRALEAIGAGRDICSPAAASKLRAVF